VFSSGHTDWCTTPIPRTSSAGRGEIWGISQNAKSDTGKRIYVYCNVPFGLEGEEEDFEIALCRFLVI
jgi:hypothetical protein